MVRNRTALRLGQQLLASQFMDGAENETYTRRQDLPLAGLTVLSTPRQTYLLRIGFGDRDNIASLHAEVRENRKPVPWFNEEVKRKAILALEKGKAPHWMTRRIIDETIGHIIDTPAVGEKRNNVG